MFGVDDAVIEHAAAQALARGLDRVGGRVPQRENGRYGKCCRAAHSHPRVLVSCFLSLLWRIAGGASAERHQSAPYVTTAPPPPLAVPAPPAQVDEERVAALRLWGQRLLHLRPACSSRSATALRQWGQR